MWFNIKIEIRDSDRAYYNFVSESYDDSKGITTLSLEVFATELITLYPNSGRGYPNFAQFREALIENKIDEISLNDLGDLYSFLEDAIIYKQSYTYGRHSMLNTGTPVFSNQYKEGSYSSYSSTGAFKQLVSDTILTRNASFNASFKLRKNECLLIPYLIQRASSILSIKVIPISTQEYHHSFTSFKKDIFKDISEALAHRYAVLDKPGKVRNLIVDSFLPQYFIKHKFNLENIQEEFRNISSTATMIHRGFARMLGIRELPLDDMLAMIGYTKERITDLLTNVRAKKLNIAFAGYGGVGTNTVYWLTELCNMANIQGLFNKIIISDFDRLSLDNVFRMPNPFKTFSALKHKDMIFNDQSNRYTRTAYCENSLYKTQTIPTDSFKALSTKAPYYGTRPLDGYIFNENHIDHLYNWIVYGAPDIESRKLFSKALNRDFPERPNYYDNCLADHIKAFISATHGDDSCGLVINPSYLENESNLMMESYGIIQLNVFFFNQLKLAISFLEVLEKYSVDELNEFRDKEFLKDYSIVNNQKSNKYNIAFQNIRTINTVENIERES